MIMIFSKPVVGSSVLYSLYTLNQVEYTLNQVEYRLPVCEVWSSNLSRVKPMTCIRNLYVLLSRLGLTITKIMQGLGGSTRIV